MWALIVVVMGVGGGSSTSTTTNIQTAAMCEQARAQFLADQDQQFVRARRITATCVQTSK